MMKKIGLLFVVLVIGTASYAQKGKISIGVDYVKVDNSYIYSYDLYPYGYYGPSYSFEPRVGWFVSDNVEIGLGFKKGDNEVEYEYTSRNPSGNGDDFTYNNMQSYSYKTFSPYVKYYKNDFFVSARISLSSKSGSYNSLNPVWEADTNGFYKVVGYDKYISETSSFVKTTSFSIGYVLSYNDRLFFEPSLGIKTNYGEVESKNENEFYYDSSIQEDNTVVSPISNSSQLSINLAVSLRLGK